MKKHILISLLVVFSCSGLLAQVPNVQLRSVEGKQVNVRELCEDGNPTIISFFATWCKPCLRELKAISDVYADWQDETEVKLVAVSIDRAQDMEKVKPLVDGNDWDYIVLLDADGELKRQMQVQTVPHLFVIDGKGKIVEQRTGYTDGEESKLYSLIKKLSK